MIMSDYMKCPQGGRHEFIYFEADDLSEAKCCLKCGKWEKDA